MILLAGFFMAVFALVAALMLYETHVESIIFSKNNGWVLLRRYRILSFWAKESLFRLEEIVRVHAAKRGFVGRDVDQSAYCLVLTIRGAKGGINKGDVIMKILETKNHQKIIKHVRSDSMLTVCS